MRRLVLVMAALSGSAGASGIDPYFVCSRMEAPENRLACYDEVARRQPAPPQTGGSASDDRPVVTGDWRVVRTRDRMTDRQIILFMLSPATGADDGRGRRTLIVRCGEDGLDAYFLSGGYLGTGRGIPVRFRLDDRPPVSQTWSASVRGDSAFASDPRGFVRSITGGGRTILIEATAFNGERYRAEFALTGIEQLAPEMNSCPAPGRRR